MRMRFVFSDTGRVWEPGMLNFTAPRVGVKWTPRGLAWATVIVGLLVTLGMADLHAQAVPLTDASVGIFDSIQKQYMQKAVQWEDGMRGIALSLFGGLAVISLAWTFIKIMLQKNDAMAFIPTMTLQIFTLGFFLYLVENGTTIATMVLSSFEEAGRRVGGTGTITPSYVVINGFDSVFRVIEKTFELSLGDSVSVGLPLILCGIAILAAFVGVAILMLVTYIEAYFVMFGGIILLGFGALPWTRDIPKNYLIYAINVGVKLFVLNLVVSIGVEFSADWPAMIAASTTDHIMHTTLYLLSGAAVFVAVAWKVPGIAAALTSGSVNFNASDIMGTTAAAAGAGAAVGAIATGGVGALASATKGAMQAQAAGTTLAAQQGASGVGAAIRGLGHAAGAVKSEAGAALKEKAGISMPSPASVDQRGRPVENLGTRAANSLHQQAQAHKEGAAAAPQNSGAGGGAAPQNGGAAGAPAPPLAAGNGPQGSGPDFQDSSKTGESRLKPPPLPPSDAAEGGVQINLQSNDD